MKEDQVIWCTSSFFEWRRESKYGQVTIEQFTQIYKQLKIIATWSRLNLLNQVCVLKKSEKIIPKDKQFFKSVKFGRLRKLLIKHVGKKNMQSYWTG